MSLFEAQLRPLRPRQLDAFSRVRKSIASGKKRPIIQGPTGFGKTLLAAHIITSAMDRGRRVVFVVPSLSLIDQTLRAFENEGIEDIGIIQAQHPRTNPNCRVQIATAQSLIRRNPQDFDLILIDEVHEVFDALDERLEGVWKDKIAIGLSATPWTKGLGLKWDDLIIAATIQELIDEGFLCPFVVHVPNQEVNRSDVAVVKGEFQESSAAKAMSEGRIVGDVVETWKDFGTGEKTFLFAVNRAHAKEQISAFWNANIPFGYIDAETSLDDRRREFEKMRYKDIAGIASVGCLIRGVDEDVRCIIDAQMTKSEKRHVQKIGRGLRTADGKPFLVVNDHAGNTLELGLVTDIYHDHLDTHKPSDRDVAYEGENRPTKPRKCGVCSNLIPKGKAVCPVCHEPVKADSGIDHVAGELVVYGAQKKEKERKYTMEEKQEWYSGFLYLANERGRNPGWASHRYKEKFGVWPNSLKKEPKPPTMEVCAYDQHLRIKYAKSMQKHRAPTGEVRA